MKQCTKCKQTLPLIEFCKCKSNKDGLQYQCKQCKYTPEYHHQYRLNNSKHLKNYIKEYEESIKLPYHIVYLIPDYKYVGVTNQPNKRMSTHRSKKNRNTNNWIELKRFNNREDALKYEAELHSQGYEGAKQ